MISRFAERNIKWETIQMAASQAFMCATCLIHDKIAIEIPASCILTSFPANTKTLVPYTVNKNRFSTDLNSVVVSGHTTKFLTRTGCRMTFTCPLCCLDVYRRAVVIGGPALNLRLPPGAPSISPSAPPPPPQRRPAGELQNRFCSGLAGGSPGRRGGGGV